MLEWHDTKRFFKAHRAKTCGNSRRATVGVALQWVSFSRTIRFLLRRFYADKTLIKRFDASELFDPHYLNDTVLEVRYVNASYL